MNIRKMFSKVGEKVRGFFTNKKKILATVAVCATVVAGVTGLQTNKIANATGTPRFNFLPGDAEMLRAAKVTDSNWADPINANIGNRVAFLLYYHNGMVDTVAHNTRVRVDLPIDQSTQLKATSYLWSDETAYITDTVVDGQIVGLSGGTINVPTNARIQYVSGSTKLFANGSTTGVAIADGITTNSGVNIGDINGCWQYAGYVTFLADIYGESNLVMDKKVAHPGESQWHDEITANPGDSAAYLLGIRNDGNITAGQISVKDILPQYMTYEVGTTYYTLHGDPHQLPNTLFTTGVNLPDLEPGQDNAIFVSYRATVNMSIPAGSWELINTAKVFQAGVEKDQDQAKVIVTAARGMVIDKKVSNGTSWVEENTANLGDEIAYRIIIRNTGNIYANSVRVRDVLPVYVSYIPGSTKVDGTVVADHIITQNGLLIGNMAPGAQKVITLRGKIYGCPPVGGYTLTNTGYVWATSVTAISDIATTIVNVTAPIAPTN